MDPLKLYVGLTDKRWFEFLAKLQPDEVNFWRPSSQQGFAALKPGEPFLFKLHAPHHFIVGGGFFVRFTRLPLSLAWSAFGVNNGTPNLHDLTHAVAQYRKVPGDLRFDPPIGNIVLTRPFFFEPAQWIPVPTDWSPSIQQGKTYRTDEAAGAALWQEVLQRLLYLPNTQDFPVDAPTPDFTWRWALQRLGQGAFRAMVTDAYNRRCAVTSEHTLPVLQAAHIKPFSQSGPHSVQNGLLLRSDIHTLFDRGYVTVDQDFRFVVSDRLKDDYENGKEYYNRMGQRLFLPSLEIDKPSLKYLEWHRQNVYLG